MAVACALDENDGLRIVYEDDGVGFPEGFDITEPGHMGMRFIQMLSKGLSGDHKWHSDPLGVQFEITVPIGS